jgi:5-hydroxyisourate hydrolase
MAAQMATITTHILDTSRGRPAAGVSVTLERRQEARGEGRTFVAVSTAVTDDDGRVKTLTESGVPAGVYRLTFEVAAYFEQQGIETFYPYVQVVFTVKDGPHHVPLLLAPHGYGTYRGS